MDEGSKTGRVTTQLVEERETFLPINSFELDFTCFNTRKMVVM
jgi:hypothetical protein